MTDTADPSRRRRLLVALDATAASLGALEAAAALAARLGAEVEALYVEDADVERLSRLPVGCFVDAWSAAPRPPDAREVEAAFRAAAERAREALSAVAARGSVRWTFRVVRGCVAEELVAAAGGADLVCVGASSGPPASQRRMGRTARAVLAHAVADVAVVPSARGLAPPFLVVHDGTLAARRALATAAALAGPGAVFVAVPGGGDAREAAARDVRDLLGPAGLARVRAARGATPEALADAASACGARTLVLPESAARALSEDLLAGLALLVTRGQG